jgi:redox-sensitive bicupin YhaK (pirin superfamily)
MTAGRGIVHSELPMQQDGLMWGFQLWVNLPAAQKMTRPRYQDIPAAAVPQITPAEGVTVRLIAGELNDRRGPVDGVPTAPLYMDVDLAAGSTVTLPTPAAHSAFVHTFDGDAVLVGGADQPSPVNRSEIAILTSGEVVTLSAGARDGRCLLVAAQPLNEPVARYGPFVMNTREELMQAVEDFQAGLF